MVLLPAGQKRVKIDNGPEGLAASQGGTNGSNPTCSSRESGELPTATRHRSIKHADLTCSRARQSPGWINLVLARLGSPARS